MTRQMILLFVVIVSIFSVLSFARFDRGTSKMVNTLRSSPPFNGREEYSKLKEALLSDSIDRVRSKFDLPLILNYKTLNKNETESYLARLLLLARQSQTLSYTGIKCQQEGAKVSCRIVENRTSKYRRNEKSAFSSTCAYRNDVWIWKGSSWKLSKVTEGKVLIAN